MNRDLGIVLCITVLLLCSLTVIILKDLEKTCARGEENRYCAR